MLGTRLFHFLMTCTYCIDYRLSSSCTCMAEEKCSFMYGACGNFRRPLEAQGAGWTRDQFVSRLFLPPWHSWILPHQSRKAMTSVLTSQSKIAMLTLLLLILTTLQENISATRSNQTLIRNKRYATHLNPIYRHFDFLKRDGNYSRKMLCRSGGQGGP